MRRRVNVIGIFANEAGIGSLIRAVLTE
ncbi:hypothetical protein EVC37_05355 [Methylocaldum sp. BRCS4]|nr:hypothetical protein [Methylocaldum sp. BRCS4]